MAQSGLSSLEPASPLDTPAKSLWRRILGRHNGAAGPGEAIKGQMQSQDDLDEDDPRSGLIRRVSRKVVPGLPRAQTFKRQQSELRDNLEPVHQTPAERRAVSVDRRLQLSQTNSQTQSNPRTSAPDFLGNNYSAAPSVPSLPASPTSPGSPVDENMLASIGELANPMLPDDEYDSDQPAPIGDALSTVDTASMTTSVYDQMIHDDLERIWILNLSMHFRDRSKREKFFVTFREKDKLWRRVTISLDYRSAPDNSLEMDLIHTKFQRDKNAKIYEAIRESLVDIQFYETVTNLKLQTTEGRLHVHVVEDVNEIIRYPTVRMIQHLRCRRVKESDIEFDSHMSGFVYKVRVDGEMLIKKEIPGPDTVDEFLYEVNALYRLHDSKHVISFYGVIVDDQDENVKGLLISFAEQGPLIDIIYDHEHRLPWHVREMWARQIVEGLSEIHEAGFVQGDFTLSNIVIDDDNNAKIIDINRRGCPVGWEPPEATPLIESNQRISMYIGVKSDLYQLGMVLWALAMQEDEPESHGRPLRIDADAEVPEWYRAIVEKCLAEDPRHRAQALQLLHMFPGLDAGQGGWTRRSPPSVDGASPPQDYFSDGYRAGGLPQIRTVQPSNDWSYVSMGHTYVDPPTGMSNEPYYYPTRGRSPPSPLPSNHDSESLHRSRAGAWAGYSYRHGPAAPSVSDAGPSGQGPEAEERSVTSKTSTESMPRSSAPGGASLAPDEEPMGDSQDITPLAEHKDLIDGAPRADVPAPVVPIPDIVEHGVDHDVAEPDQPAETSGTELPVLGEKPAHVHDSVYIPCMAADQQNHTFDSGNLGITAPTSHHIDSTKSEPPSSAPPAEEAESIHQIDSASKDLGESRQDAPEVKEPVGPKDPSSTKSGEPGFLNGIGAVHDDHHSDEDTTGPPDTDSMDADLATLPEAPTIVTTEDEHK